MVYKAISSKRFFYFILAFAVLQGLYYAFTFKEVLYDEGVHVQAVFFYISHTNPFHLIQEVRWDVLGEMARNTSYVFYYILSVPLRIAAVFTSDYISQLIVLRVIMTITFAGGLIMFRKALRLSGFSSFVVHLALLFTILLPYLSPLPGVVNYDNLLFLLFASGLYLTVKIVQSKYIDALLLLELMLLCLLGLLTKFSTALALFLPLFLFIIYDGWKKYRTRYFQLFITSYRKINVPLRILIVTTLVIGFVLVVERPIQNYIKYGAELPSCDKILSVERCKSNFTYRARLGMTRSPGQPIEDVFGYIKNYWFDSMLSTSVAMPAKSPLPFVKHFYKLVSVVGILMILINLMPLLKKKTSRLLVFTTVFFVSAFIYEIYRAYVKRGQPVAMSSRYLLPVLPIFGTLAISSFSSVFNYRIKNLILTLLVPGVLLLILQGGGIVTPILTQDTYLPTSYSQKVNEFVKTTLQIVVIKKV
ncbi:MAG: hypothetical protein ACM3KH_00880 [Thiobacillus sp.]